MDVSIYQPLVKPEMDIKRAAALDVLSSGIVPASEIDKRPGPSGKTLSYVKHTYVTRLMQDGFQNLWSFECLDYKVFHDTIKTKDKEWEQRSIAARCKLTISYPLSNGTFYDQKFTEIGAFEPNAGMSTANGVASSVSRGLVKCMMRALGIGLELYEDEGQADPTAQQTWNILKRYLETRGIEWTDDFKDELTKALEAVGINSENLVDRYTDAYEIANSFLSTDEEVPLKKK